MSANPCPANAANELALRRELLSACRRLVELGISPGTSGNLSVRLGERFLITPSGIPYDELTVERFAVMDRCARYSGPCRPTSEWRLHRTVLAARPAVGAVVHTHAPFSTALACLRREIPAVHYYVAFGGGSTIRCAAYATYGSQELADNALAALCDRDACLLANHGLLVVGATLAEAVRRSADIETLAQQYVYALQAGEPVILADDEIERVRRKLRGYGTQAADDPELQRIDSPE